MQFTEVVENNVPIDYIAMDVNRRKFYCINSKIQYEVVLFDSKDTHVVKMRDIHPSLHFCHYSKTNCWNI